MVDFRLCITGIDPSLIWTRCLLDLTFLSSYFPLFFILVNPDQEAAGSAQWEDEQIEYIKEKVSEEGRQEDLKKGKAAAQVPL